jgi:hypothetical protein
VMRLVRFDRLRVHAFLPASEYDHTTLLGKGVQVNVELPGGKVYPATGKITYVAPIVQGGRFTVQAEILNRQLANGRWLVQPGSRGRLRIDGAVALAPSTTSSTP